VAAQVYLCDTFSGVVKASDLDPAYVGGEHADTSRGQVEALLARLGLTNTTLLKGIFPDDTGTALEHLRFRLCHIDVDVYQSAKDIVDWVWPRLVVGGVIVFDDFGTASTAGVTRLVEELRGTGDRITLHNLNGHAVTVKVQP
jgi:O-methyltransferase